ncbi:endonuclease NucS domain-containing protein [Pontixanthobacter sp. CEM42]|uniref:endonuclease NucS domain-containing protein n=1 Tax=Pontixanthobacter sp. CEM42 TaxID=2792077 RepID=UPI001AE0235E|nr:endonuclease NucS domain-containing protein [Pontixanthobacter sp. CEM42]
MKNTAPIPESEIRDFLAKNPGMIEPGMTVVKAEEFLPNDQGARGFIDLFCRDKSGKYVIVEIKRSDAASREAITELYKYTTLLKRKYLLNNTEIRLIVASTHWHELLTPYSEFFHDSSFDISAKQIELDDSNKLECLTDLAPLPPVEEREIIRRHHIWEFEKSEAAVAAIDKLSNQIVSYGIEDFVILSIPLNEPVWGVEHILYVALLSRPFEFFNALIQQRFSPEEIEEFECWIEDMSEPSDRLGEAADKAMDSSSSERSTCTEIKSSGYQISHPEKARQWIPGQENIEIHRFGRFVDKTLDDRKIIDGILGDEGESFFHLDIACSLSSKPEILKVKTAIDNVFFNNPAWRQACHDALDWALATDADNVEIKAFNNDDIVRTIAAAVCGTPQFLPGLDISVDGGASRFVGSLGWNGQSDTLETVTKEFFDSDLTSYMMMHHFGEDRKINSDLMEALGLKYTINRLEGGRPVEIRFRGRSIEDVKRTSKEFGEFLETSDFTIAFVRLLEADMGFMNARAEAEQIPLEQAEQWCTAQRDPVMVSKNLHWSGDLRNCDLCHRDFNSVKFMIDGSIEGGPWACMCSLCFMQLGTGLGIGKGQLYEQTPEGWLQTAGGFPPESDEDDLT